MSVLSDAIKAEINIVEYAVQAGYTPVRRGKGYTLREHDSVHIDTEQNCFFRHSTQTGGSVIDFAMWIDNLSKEDAIKKLRSMLHGNFEQIKNRSVSVLPQKKSPREEMVLPEKMQGKFKRLYAYLMRNRCLSANVISDMVNRKMLYEDAKHHNAIWVGYDYDGKAKFACKRITVDNKYVPPFVLKNIKTEELRRTASGMFLSKSNAVLIVSRVKMDSVYLKKLLSKLPLQQIHLCFNEKNDADNMAVCEKAIRETGFVGKVTKGTPESVPTILHTEEYKSVQQPFTRGDVENSNKDVGIFVDNKSPTLFLCEAPIDAMSLMTLFELHNMDFKKYDYLIQGGVSMNAVEYHLQHQPGIQKIYLCYDNDDGGHVARAKAKEVLQKIGFTGKVIDKPPHRKDWNDDLKNLTENSQSRHQEMQPSKNLEQLQER